MKVKTMKVLKQAMELKRERAPKKVLINFKVLGSEADEIRRKAKIYTGGNITALLRISVKQFRANPKDMVSVADKAPVAASKPTPKKAVVKKKAVAKNSKKK